MKNLHQIKSNEIPHWVRQLFATWYELDKKTILYYHPLTKKCSRYSEYDIGYSEYSWREKLGWGPSMDRADLTNIEFKIKIV